MTDKELEEHVDTLLSNIRSLLDSKNKEYRSSANALSNFYDSKPVHYGRLTPLEYCLILCEKQDDAAWKTLFGNGSEISERLLDGIIYRILALIIHQQSKSPDVEKNPNITPTSPWLKTIVG